MASPLSFSLKFPTPLSLSTRPSNLISHFHLYFPFSSSEIRSAIKLLLDFYALNYYYLPPPTLAPSSSFCYFVFRSASTLSLAIIEIWAARCSSTRVHLTSANQNQATQADSSLVAQSLFKCFGPNFLPAMARVAIVMRKMIWKKLYI